VVFASGLKRGLHRVIADKIAGRRRRRGCGGVGDPPSPPPHRQAAQREENAVAARPCHVSRTSVLSIVSPFELPVHLRSWLRLGRFTIAGRR
jgi:hypothetical protein